MKIYQTKDNSTNFFNIHGWIFFQLGLFFLPSSALISGIFLLISLFLGHKNHRYSYFLDKWNYPLLIASLLMIFGSIRAYSGWLAWIGLANWIPCFWCFWGFQQYLQNAESRRRSALCLLAGTAPVLITGFGQLFFDWEGPWELFDRLIIWFITPGGNPYGRFSGLFDYANIAAAWLSLVWPFSLAALLQPSLSTIKRTLAFVFVVFIVAALVLTNSRNAWGGLILAIPFVLGSSSWFWLLPSLVLVLFPVILAVFPFVPVDLQNFARQIVPDFIWTRLNDFQFIDQRPIEATRISQWRLALDFLKERPFFGWGAAAFSLLYSLRTTQMHGHSHNLPLELSVGHGLPVAVLIIGMVLTLLLATFKRGILFNHQNKYHRNALFDRAWWTATLILIFFHGSDIPLFDSRINVAGWILLAGLRCSLRENSDRK